MYTNYQTYSKVATNTPSQWISIRLLKFRTHSWYHLNLDDFEVPPKGVSEGFKSRNCIVGSTWTSYNPEEQEVFTPRLFERLCITTSEAFALTQTPLGLTPLSGDQEKSTTKSLVSNPPASGIEPLSQEEIDTYVPVFEQLVNLQKVANDIHQGRLWRHSSK